jgi:membrane-associated phospholipid phosphatase
VNSLIKVDFLFFTYLIITTLIIFLAWESGGNSWELFVYRSLMLISIGGLIYLDKKKNHPAIRLFRIGYPLLVSGYFYSETVYYNKLIVDNIDPLLFNIESAIFKMQPSLEFSAYFSNKLISEIMYFGYFSYYLLIIGFILFIFFRNRNYFSEAVFKLSASFFIFYLIFSLIPSAGPQFYFSYPENVLPDAYIFHHVMHFIQQTAEQPTGAFPSSHVGISLIILILAKKNSPQFFSFSWPFVVILILSTVYIKAHYAIDIIGGIIIVPFILYLSHLLFHLPVWKKLVKTNLD